MLFALAESALSISVLGSAPGLSRSILASGAGEKGKPQRTALDSLASAVDGEADGAGETMGELSELLVVGVVGSMPMP
jgi:hypothetical protein